jgi:hypothetical protein
MRAKISIDTLSSVHKFVNAVSHIDEQVMLEDGNGLRVSAKSVLGSLYALEFADIYCTCDRDISGLILEWIV